MHDRLTGLALRLPSHGNEGTRAGQGGQSSGSGQQGNATATTTLQRPPTDGTSMNLDDRPATSRSDISSLEEFNRNWRPEFATDDTESNSSRRNRQGETPTVMPSSSASGQNQTIASTTQALPGMTDTIPQHPDCWYDPHRKIWKKRADEKTRTETLGSGSRHQEGTSGSMEQHSGSSMSIPEEEPISWDNDTWDKFEKKYAGV